MIDVEKLISNGTEFHMNTEYNRIIRGHRLTINGEPYKMMIFDNLLSYFEKNEEFEKCVELVKARKRIVHHENNYIRCPN